MRCNLFSNIFIHIFIFIEFFKDNLCKTIYVDSIYPSNIKINDQQVQQDDQFFYITLMFNDSIVESTEEKYSKNLTIAKINTNEKLHCIPIDKQDNDNKKIEFKFDQRLFWNSTLNYGRYILQKLGNDDISYNETLLIYLNYIRFKNPINKYEFTNQNSGKLTISYVLDNEIKKEYINRIMYTDSLSPNESPINPNEYNILDKKLIISFNKFDSPRTFTFLIYPEYDKDISPSEAQKLYLHFQDYILYNDAIYIPKEQGPNLVYFNVTFKNTGIKDAIETFTISENSGSSFDCILNCTSLNCSCTFQLGSKRQPGKLTIDFKNKNNISSQKRDIFLILYEANWEQCYLKNKMTTILIKTYWTSEIEFDHLLFFEDNNVRKYLTQSEKPSADGISKVNEYSTSSSVLSSGDFYLYSIIPDLVNYENQINKNSVNGKSLNITIYPGKDLEDDQPGTLYTNSDELQYLYFFLVDATALDEITLQNIENSNYKLEISKKTGCSLEGIIVYKCNFTNKIYNLEKYKEGVYEAYYKSHCDNMLYKIKNKIINIKRKYHLLSLTPQYFFNYSNDKEIILKYDDNLRGKKLNISIYKNNDRSAIVDFSDEPLMNNERGVRIKLKKDYELGVYNIKTQIDGDNYVYNETLFFIVIQTITSFKFSHHYFVLDNKANANDNYLLITANDTTNTFGCEIEEAERNKNLTHSNCSDFIYNIYRAGEINFNYYYNNPDLNIRIPINDSITVYQTYSELFAFDDFKNCYYYKFDINVDFSRKIPTYVTFLYNKNKNKFIRLDNETDSFGIVKYYINESENYTSIINDSYYLYISEEYRDNKVYLYKSELIEFTDIKVPEYIIKPNLAITFQEIYCNLSNSHFEIKKYNENSVSKSISNCKYNSKNKTLSCDIQYARFYSNQPFVYYTYTIENKEITDFNNEQISQTFASNILNQSIFMVEYKTFEDYNKIKVEITNKDCDFYLKLLTELTYYYIYNGIKDAEPTKYFRNNNNNNIFYIDKENCKINFSLTFGQFDIEMYYLKRAKENWEGDLGNSIYHYFNSSENKIYNSTVYGIKPNLFAYYNFTKQNPTFKLNVTLIDKNVSLVLKFMSYTFENLIKDPNPINYLFKCEVDTNALHKDEPQNFPIKIGPYDDIIYFIHYNLTEDSKKCKTKNNELGNITLYIDVPDPKFRDITNLESEIGMNVDKPYITNNRLIYTLKGTDINLNNLNYIISVSDYPEFIETFSLVDLGLNFTPYYDIKLSNNQNRIILLPSKNQSLKVKVFEDSGKINLDDIYIFTIDDSHYSSNMEKDKNSNTISITIDLDWVGNTKKNFTLSYIDKCGKTIKTSINVEVIPFSLERNYFVLNNNNKEYSETQRLKIFGPINDYTKIRAYKDNQDIGYINSGNDYYYIDFGAYSNKNGEYTFKIFNNDQEISSINDPVYVFNELSDLFFNESMPKCAFLDNEKKVLSDINYIIRSNSDKIKNIEMFESSYKNLDNNKFYTFNGRKEGNNGRKFTLGITDEIKNSISTKNKINIYLTEKNFTDQPLYVFEYDYTNITLNSLYSIFLYTDASYILFNMKCEIDNIIMNSFLLISEKSGNSYPFKCEQNSFYYTTFNYYKCFLSDNNKNTNPLLRYDGSDIVDYGNYFISYINKDYKTNEKPFYLSHEIYTADFELKKDEQIDRNQNYTAQILLNKKITYLPNIKNISYNDSKASKPKVGENLINVFTDENKYLTFKLFVEAGHIYTINSICRYNCEYCRNFNCWTNKNNYYIVSTTKDITFTFNRKYIALQNSYDDNGPNTNLIIEPGGGDKGSLKRLKVFCQLLNGKMKTYELPYNDDDKNFILDKLEPGKCDFNYTVSDSPNEPEKEFIVRNKVVLVADNDYDIFNMTELDKSCIYYNESGSLLLTSLTPNSDYKFKEYVYDGDMIISLNNVIFEYSQTGFKKNPLTPLENNRAYSLVLIEKEFQDNHLFFSKIQHEITVTSFNFDSSIPYFYKDNIKIINHICELENIYISEADSNSNNYYKLNCVNEQNNYYCEVNYKFINSKSKNFQFFIGNPRKESKYSFYFELSYIKLIYNSINDSSFEVSYSNEVVTIKSNNFDMNHIYYTKIDNDKFIYLYKKNESDLIEFDYPTPNYTSYITQLKRKDHPADREKTIKIKNVTLQIIENKCPYFLVNFHGACITCEELSKTSEGIPGNIWYEEGVCKSACNFSLKYAIYSKTKHQCYKCDLMSKITDNEYFCGCLEGTVKSFEDDICYLPESKEIKLLLTTKKNAQCYREDGKTHNYCNNLNNNTDKCTTYGLSGFLFPQCICKEGFTGKYCEYKENSIDLEKKITNIFSDENNNEIINEANANIISNIRGIIYFLEKDETKYIQTIKDDYMDQYIKFALNNLNKIINGEKNTTSQIYDVLELAIYFLKYKISNPSTLRNLENNYYKRNLSYILENIHLAHFYGNENLDQDYNIQYDDLGLTSFVTYKASITSSDDFRQEMANTTLFKIMEYIEIEKASEDDLIYVTLINITLFDENENEGFGVKAYFSTSNSNIDLSQLKNISYYVSSTKINFNYDLAQYYKDKKVLIYDKNDPIFIDPCFLSKAFDFDLTQKYRKKHVFQKIYYGNEVCIFKTFLPSFNTLQFECNKFIEIGKMNLNDLTYGILTLNFKDDSIDNADKAYNLPTKCTKRIDDLGGNYAFWLFLIICMFEIIYIIGINILTLGSLKKISFRKGLVHDELYYHIRRIDNGRDEDEVNSNDEQLSHKEEKMSKFNKIKDSSYQLEKNNNDLLNDKFYKTFAECILSNLKELHPIATLCRVSIISPLILHSWFFIFNTLILFGFNALIYYEDLIEKRIYDKKRNYFDYPMRKEFHKIILSILCQIVLTLLLKCILMVRLNQRQNLKISLSKCILKGNEEINNEIVSRVEQFQDEMLLRRLITAALMIVGVVFFFYYSVVFCGIYIQTQKNWFYSGVWSLFWVWVIFSPIYIIIISYIEFKKSNSFDPLVYNLKRLFFF